ncbi:hypothetical protein [Clostridium sp. BNL1100]|uniref:hypothetical protein n=1 Tax=Clostridium sp. BNL1100 TaxID=755731 RepID=UPI00024A7FE7|nr:hypothetical protein [Clostridium sp. BNL1100]AEY68103.1 hypothetical protein Clo1100_3996 [Clostridium sp. BNL1100]
MGNFKKISAAVVAGAIMLSSVVPTFAAAYTPVNGEKASVLNQLELYAGTSDTSFVPSLETSLTRGQGATLLAKLFNMDTAAQALTEDEANAILKDFADADKIPTYAKKRLAYLVKNNIMSGSKDTTTGDIFVNADEALLGGQFATLILKQLGYTVSSWTEAIDQLSEVDGAKEIADYLAFAKKSVLRDQAVGIMFGSLTSEYSDGKATIIDKIVEAKPSLRAIAENAGLIATPAVLAVDSVKALNLRELVITFNKAVVTEEAKKATNYEINDANPAAVDVSADGKTVTLRTSNANRMSNYATDIKLEVLKAVGLSADTTISNISAKDITVPSVVSVEATGPRNLKVTFSEPLNEDVTTADTVNSFKLDNGFVALDTTSATYSGNVLSLKTLGDLSEGAHSLQVKNDSSNKLVDSANYTVTPTSSSFNYVKDTSPLTVKVVESTETTATIQFSKPIDATTLTANVLLRHTYNTSTNQVDGTSLVNSGDDQKFTVTFPDNMPFAPGASNLYIVYQNDAAIKDNYGNKLPETTLTINTTADLTKPTVSKVDFISATSLEVTFSEKVLAGTGSNGAENTALYTLKDSTGTVIAVTGAAFKDSTNKVVVLTTNTMNGGSYTLTVKDVKDVSVAKNEMDDATISFTGVDKVAPTVSSTKQIGDNKIKVTFSEVMDVATITDKGNWMHNSAALDANDTIVAADGNKAVIITFKNNLNNTDANSDSILDSEKLTLARVKDVVGNWSESFSQTLDVTKASNIVYTKAEMTATDKIRLTFEDEVISGATTGDFEVSFDNGSTWTVKVIGMSVSVVDGDTIMTLTTDSKAANTQTTNVQVRTKDGAATTSAKNAYNKPLEFTAATLTDKVAPSIVSVVTKDTGVANNKIDAIEITYSENLYVASVSDADYTVEGYEITGVVVNGAKVIITVKEKDIVDSNATPKVTQVGQVEDSLRNVLSTQDVITSTDGIA